MEKPSSEQIKRNMERFLNQRVQLMGDHPNSGEYGLTVRSELQDGCPAMIVKLDSGKEVPVTNNAQIFFLIGQIEITTRKKK